MSVETNPHNYTNMNSFFPQFVAAEFPKTPSPKPARIPPPDPSCGREISRGKAKNQNPKKNRFSLCRVRIVPPPARILGGQNPERKTPFPFSKEISPPPNQESKECFSFGVAEALRGSGGMVHSSSGLVSKYIRTLSNKHRQKMKSGSEAKIWSARSAVCSEFPQKILNLKGFATLRVAPRLPIQNYD